MSVDPYQPPKTSTQEVDPTLLTEPAYSDGLDFLFLKEFKSPLICFLSGVPMPDGSKMSQFNLRFFNNTSHSASKFIVNTALTILLYICLFKFEIFYVFIVLIPYIVISLLLAKEKGYVYFYYEKKMKRTVFWKSILMSLPIGLASGFAVTARDKEPVGNLTIALFIIGITLFCYLIERYTRPKAISIHAPYYRLRGAHPDFLAHFPSVPR